MVKAEIPTLKLLKLLTILPLPNDPTITKKRIQPGINIIKLQFTTAREAKLQLPLFLEPRCILPIHRLSSCHFGGKICDNPPDTRDISDSDTILGTISNFQDNNLYPCSNYISRRDACKNVLKVFR